jgi:hypothetical protein
MMRQMMPSVATMLMGGLSKSAASEGLADMFEQFAHALRGGTPAARPQSQRTTASSGNGTAPDPFAAWANMLGSMWGGASPNEPKAPEVEPPGNDAAPNSFAPWTAMMSGMLGGETTPEPPDAKPSPKAAREAAPEPPNPFEFFSHMVETGIGAQQQYVAALQNIFDSYWGAGAKRR